MWDNIGLVSDQLSQFHAPLEESKQDFERDRHLLHEFSVRSDSGRALGFEINVEELRTLTAVERFGRIRKGIRCFLKRRRVAGWELEGLMGHATFLGLLRRETLSLFHCPPVRSQILSLTGTSVDGCTWRARGVCGSHALDRVRLGQAVAF